MFPQINRPLEFFLRNPTTQIHLRELARQIKMSPAGTLKAVNKLVKEGLVEEKKTLALTSYKAKLTFQFHQLKKIYNYGFIYSSGLIKFLEETYENPETIILFGSYAEGEDTEKSDIDLAIITPLEKSVNLNKYEKLFMRKINLLEIKDLKKAKKEFIDNLINGVIISGVLKI